MRKKLEKDYVVFNIFLKFCSLFDKFELSRILKKTSTVRKAKQCAVQCPTSHSYISSNTQQKKQNVKKVHNAGAARVYAREILSLPDQVLKGNNSIEKRTFCSSNSATGHNKVCLKVVYVQVRNPDRGSQQTLSMTSLNFTDIAF